MAENIDIQIKTNAKEVSEEVKVLKTELDNLEDRATKLSSELDTLSQAEHNLYLANTTVHLTGEDVATTFDNLVKNSNNMNKSFGKAIDNIQLLNSDKGLKGTTSLIAKANIGDAVSKIGPLPGLLGQVTNGIRAVGAALSAGSGPLGIALAALSAIVAVVTTLIKKHKEEEEAARRAAAEEARLWAEAESHARGVADSIRDTFNISTIDNITGYDPDIIQNNIDRTLDDLKRGAITIENAIETYEAQLSEYRTGVTDENGFWVIRPWSDDDLAEYEKQYNKMFNDYKKYLDNCEEAAKKYKATLENLNQQVNSMINEMNEQVVKDIEDRENQAAAVAEKARQTIVGDEQVAYEQYLEDRKVLIDYYGEESYQVEWLDEAYNKLHGTTETYDNALRKLINTFSQFPTAVDVEFEEFYTNYLNKSHLLSQDIEDLRYRVVGFIEDLRNGGTLSEALSDLFAKREENAEGPKELLEKETRYQNAVLEEEKQQVYKRIELLEQYMENKEFAVEHEQELEALRRQAIYLTYQQQQNYLLKERKLIEIRQRSWAQAAGDLGSIFDSFSSCYEQDSAAQKGFALASTIMNTYQAAQLAYTSAFLPVPNVSSPILGYLSMAAAIASGLANVHQILSVKTDGTETGSSARSGAAATPQATVLNADSYANVLSDTTFADLQMNAVENQKVYVVSSEISESQNSNKTVVTTSTF